MPPTRMDRQKATCGQELRCACHRLLARIEADALILKCPRCKREAVLRREQWEHGGEITIRFCD